MSYHEREKIEAWNRKKKVFAKDKILCKKGQSDD